MLSIVKAQNIPVGYSSSIENTIKDYAEQGGVACPLADESIEPTGVCVYLFYGETCPHCAEEEEFLEELESKYPELQVHGFEIYYNSESRQIYEKITGAYHISTPGVPLTVIGDKAFLGFSKEGSENPSTNFDLTLICIIAGIIIVPIVILYKLKILEIKW
jgi:thiol-disulfide isomerase/thioredoxin